MKKIFIPILFLLFSIKGFSQVGAFNVGDTAPDFTVTDVHGKVHKLSDYTAQGKDVMIDFFEYYCNPCQVVAPRLNKFYHKYGCNKGSIIVLGIDYGDNIAAVIDFDNKFTGTDPYPSCSGIDGGGNAVTSAYGIKGFPAICLIGADGKFKHLGIWGLDNYPPSFEYLESETIKAGITLTPMECVVGIEDISSSVSTSVYPNPVADLLHIAGENIKSIAIYNNIGGNIFDDTSQNSIDVSSFAEGIYFVKILDFSENISFHKFVIKR